MVHNHGPAEGRGLDCGEVRLPDGTLRGRCLITADKLAAAHAVKPKPTPEQLLAEEAEAAWAEHSIGFAWDSEEHRYGEYRAFLAGFEAARRAA